MSILSQFYHCFWGAQGAVLVDKGEKDNHRSILLCIIGEMEASRIDQMFTFDKTFIFTTLFFFFAKLQELRF